MDEYLSKPISVDALAAALAKAEAKLGTAVTPA
jgi:YesN/AraC family two-component response regulator